MTEYRNEWKYLCTAVDLECIRRRISVLMPSDVHQAGRNCYNIRSLYFDDIHDRCYYANQEGLDYRRKFRIRIYDHSPAHIRLEIKYKIHGYTKKESCPITESQCRLLMEGKSLPWDPSYPKPLQDLCLSMKTQSVRPVEIVEYERTAYTYPIGNVRVTFDRNIAGSNYIRGFLDQQIPLLPILPQGIHVLEVKHDELLPLHIKSALDIGRLERCSFSKYFLCRERLKLT